MVNQADENQLTEMSAMKYAGRKSGLVTLKFGGAITGTLVGLSPDGIPLVDFPGNPAAAHLNARSCVEVGISDVGKEVVLLFDDGDGLKPIVIGTIQPSIHVPAKEHEIKLDSPLDKATVEIDGKTIELAATEKLTLRCGAASITLTRDGKVLVRGTYLQSRSSGVNRIQGGSVQIN
jgi:hypothetical protein